MFLLWLRRVARGALFSAICCAVIGGFDAALAIRMTPMPLMHARERVLLWLTGAGLTGALGLLLGGAGSALSGSMRGFDPRSRELFAMTGRDPRGPWLTPAFAAALFGTLGATLTPMWLGAASSRDSAITISAATVVFVSGVLATTTVRRLLRQADETGRPVGALVLGPPLLLALSLSMGASAGRGPRAHGSPQATPNLLLVTADGLRADHVGPDARVRTETLPWLQREGTLLSTVISPSAEESPPLAALLTGRHPISLGFVSDGARLPDRTRSGGAVETLASRLSGMGYRTAAFVGSRGLDGRATGFDRGFELYDDELPGMPRGSLRLGLPRLCRYLSWLGAPPRGVDVTRPAETSIARFEEWLAWTPEGPLFAWIHLAEPRRDGSGGASGPDVRDPIPGPEGLAYAGRVVDLDQQFRSLLEGVDADRGLDDWVVLVVGSRGLVPGSTAPSVSDAWTRVPGLVLGGGAPAGVVVEQELRTEDLGATLLAAAGLRPDLGDGVPGLMAEGAVRPSTMALLLGPDRDAGRSLALREGDWKFVREPTGREVLFDLRSDPRELADASGRDPVRAAAMARTLSTLVPGRLPPVPGPRGLRAQELRALR